MPVRSRRVGSCPDKHLQQEANVCMVCVFVCVWGCMCVFVIVRSNPPVCQIQGVHKLRAETASLEAYSKTLPARYNPAMRDGSLPNSLLMTRNIQPVSRPQDD